MPMHRQARGTRGQALPEGCALLSLALEIRKELGACSLQLNRLARIFGKFLASGFFDEGMASEKNENHRINTGDLWWAWMDLNHRPRPYQDSVVRSYKNLQVPRGLPKTAQVLQGHSYCGFNCGLKISASAGEPDHLRPGADCPYRRACDLTAT